MASGSAVVVWCHCSRKLWIPFEPSISNHIENRHSLVTNGNGQSNHIIDDIGHLSTDFASCEIDLQRQVLKMPIEGTEQSINRHVCPPGSLFSNNAVWEFEGNPHGKPWIVYDIETSQLIEDAVIYRGKGFNKRKHCSELDLKTKSTTGLPYIINIKKKFQINTKTSKRRRIRRTELTQGYTCDTTGSAAGAGGVAGAAGGIAALKRKTPTCPVDLGNNVPAAAAMTTPKKKTPTCPVDMGNNFSAGPIGFEGLQGKMIHHVKLPREKRIDLGKFEGSNRENVDEFLSKYTILIDKNGHKAKEDIDSLPDEGNINDGFDDDDEDDNDGDEENGGVRGDRKDDDDICVKQNGTGAEDDNGDDEENGGAQGNRKDDDDICVKENGTGAEDDNDGDEENGGAQGARKDDDDICVKQNGTSAGGGNKKEEEEDEECAICFDYLSGPSGYGDNKADADDVIRLGYCLHTFHKLCVVQMYRSCGKDGYLECPTCKRIHGEKIGNCPAGSMDWTRRKHMQLPGHEGCGALEISYTILRGIQSEGHPNPGNPYNVRGFPRRGYLPDTDKGRIVLKLLMEAFRRRLMFTVGTSSTTGEDDTVTWNDIHHKTETVNRRGHGYPDPNYLDNVMMELVTQGVTMECLDERL